MRLSNKDIVNFYRKKRRRPRAPPAPVYEPDFGNDDGVNPQSPVREEQQQDNGGRDKCNRHRPADDSPYDNFVTMYYRRSPRR